MAGVARRSCLGFAFTTRAEAVWSKDHGKHYYWLGGLCAVHMTYNLWAWYSIIICRYIEIHVRSPECEARAFWANDLGTARRVRRERFRVATCEGVRRDELGEWRKILHSVARMLMAVISFRCHLGTRLWNKISGKPGRGLGEHQTASRYLPVLEQELTGEQLDLIKELLRYHPFASEKFENFKGIKARLGFLGSRMCPKQLLNVNAPQVDWCPPKWGQHRCFWVIRTDGSEVFRNRLGNAALRRISVPGSAQRPCGVRAIGAESLLFLFASSTRWQQALWDLRCRKSEAGQH